MLRLTDMQNVCGISFLYKEKRIEREELSPKRGGESDCMLKTNLSNTMTFA